MSRSIGVDGCVCGPKLRAQPQPAIPEPAAPQWLGDQVFVPIRHGHEVRVEPSSQYGKTEVVGEEPLYRRAARALWPAVVSELQSEIIDPWKSGDSRRVNSPATSTMTPSSIDRISLTILLIDHCVRMFNKADSVSANLRIVSRLPVHRQKVRCGAPKW